MGSIFENYTNLYSVSKTLRFSLIPMYETESNIQKYGILNNDEIKASEYKKVKELFDRCHKAYIEKRLVTLNPLDWSELYAALIRSQQDKTDEFYLLSQEYKNAISHHLKSGEEYKLLKPDAIIKSVVKDEETLVQFTPEEKESIKVFNRFSSYFLNYSTTRENIYDVLQTSIAYRLITENFPKFVSNIKLFEQLEDKVLNELEEQLNPLLNGYTLRQVFADIDNNNFYNHVLTQSGIDFYNYIIGGKVINDTAIQGLNSLLHNKYQRGELAITVRFAPLYKLILSDKETDLFIQDAYKTDIEVLNSIVAFGNTLNQILDETIDDFKEVFSSDEIDTDKIYVNKQQLAVLSQYLYGEGKWHILSQKLKEKGIKDSKIYTLTILNEVAVKNILEDILPTFLTCLTVMKNNFFELMPLFEKDKINNYDDIKKYLDSVQTLEHILKIFAASDDADKDMTFYPVFDLVYGALRSNISLYNKVRNYATKKPYSIEKFKLNFENPSLAGGWDQNKEYSYNTFLFIKDGLYYLGIANAKNKIKLCESDIATDGCYSKMIYKFLPGPNKMLPKVFFSKKGLETFGKNEYILEGYKAGKHLKGKNFDINFCHELIDYFKDCISKHEDWSKFNFKFSDTETFSDIGAFYNEISNQNYKVSFSYVADEDIRKYVEEGNLFLFKIYSKDFSEHSKGKPNLHTLYWKELFTAENLQNPIFKLNGGAELFYRPASIDNPFIHKEGSILVNKNDKNNNPIPDAIYEKLIDEIHKGRDISELERIYPEYTFKLAKYNIIKDKRYNKAAFSFHIPITINYGKSINDSELNKRVLDDISWNPEVNIIGIARGERNLIYVSVINQKGDILKQKSFNIINNPNGNVNYHKKLDILEKERDSARKNWKNIDKIKDLKEGYLSIVIKEIVDMMIEYNAIIALEDLNLNFKNRRVHIEKQIYQKFEKMLIDKLNYFADKNIDITEKGSIRHGYQLATKFESFKRLGKHTGFIFYVPISYTSSIDPTTGFVNLFTAQQLNYQNIRQSQKFIKNFNEIAYDKELDCFKFDFKYSNFDIYKEDYTDSWTVYSYGKNRTIYIKENGIEKSEKINATDELKALFEDYNLNYKSGNLIEQISMINNKDFFIRFLLLFKSIMQIRYMDDKESFILSPVHKNGRFFDSRFANSNEPCDADANGAYHIALQGLRIIRNRIKDGKIISDGTGKQAYNWFEFVQKKDYLN